MLFSDLPVNHRLMEPSPVENERDSDPSEWGTKPRCLSSSARSPTRSTNTVEIPEGRHAGRIRPRRLWLDGYWPLAAVPMERAIFLHIRWPHAVRASVPLVCNLLPLLLSTSAPSSIPLLTNLFRESECPPRGHSHTTSSYYRVFVPPLTGHIYGIETTSLSFVWFPLTPPPP